MTWHNIYLSGFPLLSIITILVLNNFRVTNSFRFLYYPTYPGQQDGVFCIISPVYHLNDPGAIEKLRE